MKPEAQNLERAISMPQPWAWLTANGWRNIINIGRSTPVRGPVLIHAGKAKSRDNYEAALLFVASYGFEIDIPDFYDLDRGGIVGQTTILDCVRNHNSEWFTGPWGLVVEQSQPVKFTPCMGDKGFFKVCWPELNGKVSQP